MPYMASWQKEHNMKMLYSANKNLTTQQPVVLIFVVVFATQRKKTTTMKQKFNKKESQIKLK